MLRKTDICSREIETMKKNWMDILELKNTKSEIKVTDELISRMDMTEEEPVNLKLHNRYHVTWRSEAGKAVSRASVICGTVLKGLNLHPPPLTKKKNLLASSTRVCKLTQADFLILMKNYFCLNLGQFYASLEPILELFIKY